MTLRPIGKTDLRFALFPKEVDASTRDSYYQNFAKFADSAAMTSIAVSSVVMDEVSTSSTAMDAVSESETAMDAVIASEDIALDRVVNTTGDAPSEASLKLGEVDTANDAKSDQWYLAAEDGTLTFPDKAAADAASAALRVGTVVYDRAGNSHYYVTE